MTEPTIRLTMAQALVKFLQVQYSERDGIQRRFIPGMFGIFGHGNVSGLGQALFEYGADLPYYQPCNEQSMVHSAIGYAKACHRKSTLACASSIGPGSTNMITGAATATVNRLPVLLLASDYYATRRQGPVLQQLEHPVSADMSVNDCFRPVSRFFDRISRPEQLLTALPEAIRVLTDAAETGAVTLALPQDVQAHAYDYPARLFNKRIWRMERRLPDPQRVSEATTLLKQAKRPVIIAGGGIHYSEASDDLKAFAERFGIPVVETFAGKGAMRGRSPLALGGHGVTGTPAAARIVAESDLIIVAGTRLTDFTTGSQSAFQHADVRFININVCAHDAYKQGGIPILGDAKEVFRAWLDVASQADIGEDKEYLELIGQAKREWENYVDEELPTPVPGEVLSQGQLIGVLNKVARSGDTIIAAAGSPPGDLHKLWDVSSGSVCHLEFGFSCMGYELPAGLGVRMAQPDGEVYVFIGDGTYLMNPTELVTAMQERLKVTVIVAENHGYQVIRQLQMNRAGHSFGNEFRARDQETNRLEGQYLEIDFAQNAASMGARSWHVSSTEELCRALLEARAETRACVIVAEVEKHRYLPPSGVWWDVAAAEVTNDEVTSRLRTEYEKQRTALQRFYY